MNLYIVTIERGEKMQTYAVHCEHRESAAARVLGRNSGWSLVNVTEKHVETLLKIYHGSIRDEVRE